MWTSIALVVVSVYAIILTYLHASTPKYNPLCLRDFVQPTASGTCLCGENEYCLCTPSLASDVIIELEGPDGVPHSVVFIERRDGRGLAMVGGFVKVGESAEEAATREALEETGLSVTELRQWCMFSRARRDPRRHTAAQVFVGRARGVPRSGDDAKGVRTVAISELQRTPPKFAFDHGEIVAAFVASHHPLEPRRRRNRSIASGTAYDDACRPR